MSGRLFKGILLLLVLSAACFLASPISSGEHPWGSDRGEGGGDVDPDTGLVALDDSTSDSVLVSGGTGDEVNTVPAWFSTFTSVWSSMSTMF